MRKFYPTEPVPRISTELDKILGQEFPVLHDGFIRVIDYMGGDSSIVQAARVSYGIGTKSSSDDRKLIRRLMRDVHTSPFEMCEIKLHVRVPMDCWRQWIRHRTANVNEYSTRYSEAIDATEFTLPGEWRLQSQDNKQGSAGVLTEWPAGYTVTEGLDKGKFNVWHKDNIVAEFDHRPTPGEYLSSVQTVFQAEARDRYNEKLEFGVARELSRADLPLSTYTEAYWKIDLHNLLHFTRLRIANDAQHEIRQFTKELGKVVSRWCPLTWEAFTDYRRDALSLSRLEVELMQFVVAGKVTEAFDYAYEQKLIRGKSNAWKPNGDEGKSLQRKFDRIGISLPWEGKDAELK